MNKKIVMKCCYCGGDVIEFSPYSEDNKFFGRITVDVPDEKCTNCGACFMSYELSQALNNEYQKRIEDFLVTKHDPAQFYDEYYNVDETTKILKLNKNIDSTMYEYLIYRINFNGKLLFWKPSVDLFSQTRDGRIKIL